MITNIDQICRYLAKQNDPQRIKDFLSGLFTPAEIRDMESRWEIVKRLNNGHTQRAIARELHLGLCKITRGSKELKKPGSPLKQAVEEITKNKS